MSPDQAAQHGMPPGGPAGGGFAARFRRILAMDTHRNVELRCWWAVGTIIIATYLDLAPLAVISVAVVRGQTSLTGDDFRSFLVLVIPALFFLASVVTGAWQLIDRRGPNAWRLSFWNVDTFALGLLSAFILSKLL